jgi:hypothetical protein
MARRKDHRAKLAVDANFVDFLEIGPTQHCATPVWIRDLTHCAHRNYSSCRTALAVDRPARLAFCDALLQGAGGLPLEGSGDVLVSEQRDGGPNVRCSEQLHSSNGSTHYHRIIQHRDYELPVEGRSVKRLDDS